MRTAGWILLALVVGPSVFAQDVGELLGPADDLLGDTVPPALDQVYTVAGQNITREDVRMQLAMEFTKGDVGVVGFLIGSGTAEVEAHIRLQVDMRVISSDRIRAALEGENAYNIEAHNATFLSQAYLPAEVFRATLAAEVIAAFQAEQEAALSEYIARAVPELQVLGLDIEWENTSPQQTIDDTSLTEPPLTVTLDATVRYLRTESIPSLLKMYLDRDPGRSEGKKAYVEQLKRENGDPPTARDFFGAAAYTQLLNLSMQPGWALGVDMQVPRGYSFEYANDEVTAHSPRHISFAVDALEKDEEDQAVLLASLTHRRGVALALFSGLLVAGAVLGALPAYLYVRHRLPAIQRRLDALGDEAAPGSG